MIQFFIILASSLALADSEQITCGVAQHYVPPKSDNQPHKITLEDVDLVFWTEDLDKMELLPWSLVTKNICIQGNVTSKHPFRSTVTIREYSQIRLVEVKK